MKTIEELQRRAIELDIEAKERQKEFDKGMQELRASQAQTEKLVHETSQQIKKTDEKLDRIAKMVGGISRSQGAVAEEFFFNTISAIIQTKIYTEKKATQKMSLILCW